MRIAFLASTYPRFETDGSGRFVRSLAEAMHALGHTVDVLAPYHPQVGVIDSPVCVHHFRYIWPARLNIMGYAQAMDSDRSLRRGAYALAPLYFAAALLNLDRLERRNRYDAVHVHWVIPNGPAAAWVARRHRLPLVVSLHGSDIFFALKNRWLGRLAASVFSQAVAVSACSPALQAGAVQLGARPEKVHLIPWGADPVVFAPAGDPAAFRAHWGLAPDAPVILSLGRLVEKKGVAYLIRAAPEVLSAQPLTRFVVAGDGPERQPLQQLAETLGVAPAMCFTGELPWAEVPLALQACDIFVAPSAPDERGNLDGLPTTILEAMAAARPVVASRVAGIPLAVTDQVTGLLVPPADSGLLAQALLRMLADPALAQAYGRAGRQRVEQELNWQSIARRFVNFYQLESAAHD